MNLDDKIMEQIKTHAAEEAPRECCGIVIITKGRQCYMRCRNVSETEKSFVMHHEDQAIAEDKGTPAMIVHSHVYESPQPSEADLTMCERTGLPWLIINYPVGHYVQIEPSGYKAPLIGRRWSHGILDCYTLCRDYYRETCGIELPDFEREEHWWEKGFNLYADNFEKAGFVEVKDLRVHDGVIMHIKGRTADHAGVLCRDNILLHHQMGRLSTEDVYGGYWRMHTSYIVRHKSLL